MLLTRRTLVLTAAAMALAFASCASNSNQSPKSGAVARADGAKGALGQAKASGAGGSTGAAAAAAGGAQYTIYCLTLPGEGHVPRSTQLRDQLVRGTGMRDWYVVHAQDESTLYYGHYRAIDREEDAKEAARARADREKIDAMVDAQGGRPFRDALLVAMASPDPDAPTQWDLRAAPPGMAWSLQIAAYEGHPDRKKFAVDAVKAFRQNGVPAYYYHGDTVSSVCLGAWPEDAVRGDLEPAYNDPTQKRSMDQIMSQTPGADLLVVAPGLPPVNKEVKTRGRTLRAVSPHLEVVDPTLLATMKNYPHHYVNGLVEGMKTAQGVQGKPSFLVKIPRDANSILGGGYDATVAGSTSPGRPADSNANAVSGLPPGVGTAGLSGRGVAGSSASAPAPSPSSVPVTSAPRPTAPQPGYGRLRSLEDR